MTGAWFVFTVCTTLSALLYYMIIAIYIYRYARLFAKIELHRFLLSKEIFISAIIDGFVHVYDLYRQTNISEL